MAKRGESNSRLVYSTDGGRVKPSPPAPRPAPSGGTGTIRVSRERKGRGGKTVTIARGFSLPDDELKQLAQRLKQQCGCGGSVPAPGEILLQGDRMSAVLRLLEEAGHPAKQAGG